ncbi:hypothetical protein BDV97DRAFT_91520 [Delphinella strobiligena]|nr:hypothetical protein BDV97DRAFT_91520 [Delphinella strobiligena]
MRQIGSTLFLFRSLKERVNRTIHLICLASLLLATYVLRKHERIRETLITKARYSNRGNLLTFSPQPYADAYLLYPPIVLVLAGTKKLLVVYNGSVKSWDESAHLLHDGLGLNVVIHRCESRNWPFDAVSAGMRPAMGLCRPMRFLLHSERRGKIRMQGKSFDAHGHIEA